MAKTVQTSLLSSARPYTVEDLCTLLKLSRPRIEKLVAAGLRPVHSGKPRLFRGSDVKAALSGARARKAEKLPLGTFRCMHCKAPRRPLYGMVDYEPGKANSGHIKGICEVCDHTISAFCGAHQLTALRTILDVSVKAGPGN